MTRPKKELKAKEEVKLRCKQLANGNQSLYLDFYQQGKREYEFLKLYLIPVKSTEDKAKNDATLKLANRIKTERQMEVDEGKGIRTAKAKKSELLLTAWVDILIERKSKNLSVSSVRGLHRLNLHLVKYNPNVKLVEVDKSFCIGFIDYLRTAKCLTTRKDGKECKPLAQTTQVEMQNALSIVLNEAVREELILTNATRMLSRTEKISKPDSSREYLTIEEVQRLIATPVVLTAKADADAFLFSCFCGLRWSDIEALTWSNLRKDGDATFVSLTMKKTKHKLVAPLSAKALAYLPKRGDNTKDSDKVFNLPDYGITCRRLKKWAKDAEINKNVTFHVARHTFATMLLTGGADLYVTSKLLGHTEISTTQIYAKIVDQRKQETVSLLDKLF